MKEVDGGGLGAWGGAGSSLPQIYQSALEGSVVKVHDFIFTRLSTLFPFLNECSSFSLISALFPLVALSSHLKSLHSLKCLCEVFATYSY